MAKKICNGFCRDSRIVEAGRPFDLKHAGLKALNSLRMEKGYRDYGHDMDNTDNPYEVGLGGFVKLNKADDFIGKDACIKLKQEDDKTKRLAQALVNDPSPTCSLSRSSCARGKRSGMPPPAPTPTR